jgi:ABC-type antimicrobial peptide transport system permease subunit
MLKRYIGSQLYGVGPTDPLTMIAAVSTLAVVALAAGYLPARRATKVNPVLALRYE